MRSHLRIALLATAVTVPVLACQVEATYRPPVVEAQVQVEPPPATVQVDVNAQQPDPNAQAQVDPNAPVDQVADTDASSLTDFREALTPVGTWSDDPQYGTIWTPSPAVVGADFTPYQTAGHWVYDTDYTWVSDYDWGWAPFHYGRWAALPGRGWSWIPGHEYAGAWVTWRNGDDGYGFVGWSPTPPAYYWRGGQSVVITTPWYTPRYVYAANADLFAPSIGVRLIRDPVRIGEFERHTRPFEPSHERVAAGGGIRINVRGPAPTHLGLKPENLPRPPANHPGLAHAQQFARAPARTNAQLNGSVGNHGTTSTHPIATGGSQSHPVEQHPGDTHVTQNGGGSHPVDTHPGDTHVTQNPGTTTQHNPVDQHVQQVPAAHETQPQQTAHTTTPSTPPPVHNLPPAASTTGRRQTTPPPSQHTRH